MPQDDTTRGARVRGGLLLALILLAAAALRAHDITRHSLWLDELFTMQASAGYGLEHQRLMSSGLREPPPDLLSLRAARPWPAVATTLARDDNHPPLYFLLVRGWRHAFGGSDAALRALSAVLSVVAVWLLYDVVALLHDRRAAAWAALMMAVAGPQIQFAQEARAYALLLVLVLVACDAVVRIERRGPTRARCAGLALAALGMMLTHYYAIAPAAAVGLYALIRLRGRARRDAVVSLVAAALLFGAVWGWGLWRQRANVAANNWWIIETLPGHGGRTLMRLAILPFRYLTEPLLRAQPVAGVGAALYVVPLLLLRRRPELLLWALLLLLPVGLTLATDLWNHSKQLEFLRYPLAASPAVYALIATLLPAAAAPTSRPRAWLAHVLPAAAVATALFNLPLAYAETQTPKPDWRRHAALIDALARPEDVVVFYGDSRVDPGFTGSHYLALSHYARRLPRATLFISSPPDADQLARLRAAPAVWLVLPLEVTLPHDSMPGFVLRQREFIFGLPMLLRWERVPGNGDAAQAPAR